MLSTVNAGHTPARFYFKSFYIGSHRSPSVRQRFYVCITPESDRELNSSVVPAAIASKESESAAAPTAV